MGGWVKQMMVDGVRLCKSVEKDPKSECLNDEVKSAMERKEAA